MNAFTAPKTNIRQLSPAGGKALGRRTVRMSDGERGELISECLQSSRNISRRQPAGMCHLGWRPWRR